VKTISVSLDEAQLWLLSDGINLRETDPKAADFAERTYWHIIRAIADLQHGQQQQGAGA
jgi:hypothetical protein